MDFAEYKKIEAINASSIKQGKRSMLHMRQAMLGEISTDSPAMRTGRLAHLAILEPVRFAAQVRIYDGRRAGKEYDALALEVGPDNIVEPDEYQALLRMIDAVHANRDAHNLLEGIAAEVTMQWETSTYGAAKARLDGHSDKRGIIELKTMRDVSQRAFIRQVTNMGYDLAAGWYVEGIEQSSAITEHPAFHFICVESKPPYDVAVYRMPALMVEMGRTKAIEIATQYRKCEAAGQYPGAQFMGVEELQIPDWYLGDIVVSGSGEINASDLLGEES